jgi:hypothetical protein
MRTNYYLGMVALLFLTLGCATAGQFRKKMDSWLGGDVNRAIQAWGPPSNTYTLPNGQRMFTWLHVGGTLVTANYNSYLNMITAGSVTYWCEVSFTAQPSGVIATWSARGNSCRA